MEARFRSISGRSNKFEYSNTGLYINYIIQSPFPFFDFGYQNVHPVVYVCDRAPKAGKLPLEDAGIAKIQSADCCGQEAAKDLKRPVLNSILSPFS